MCPLPPGANWLIQEFGAGLAEQFVIRFPGPRIKIDDKAVTVEFRAQIE